LYIFTRFGTLCQEKSGNPAPARDITSNGDTLLGLAALTTVKHFAVHLHCRKRQHGAKLGATFHTLPTSERPPAKIWGRCYDHNFMRCLPIFWVEIGVFLKKTMLYLIIFSQTKSSLSKKPANIYAKFLVKNILKIITSVPGHCRQVHLVLTPKIGAG
jgi:hypothetical protein